MKDLFKILEPGLFRVWHEFNHPYAQPVGSSLTCPVCEITVHGRLSQEEYDAIHDYCPECGQKYPD